VQAYLVEVFGFSASDVRVLDADGNLEVACATADIGTGSYTVMAQVAGETLGVALDKISVKLGDSDLPAAPVEGGSWGAASTGAAVQLACTTLADELYKAAAKVEGKPLAGARRDEVAFQDGCLVVRANPSLGALVASSAATCGVSTSFPRKREPILS
jgi:xanthine dehydrogenase YagR molybdenum-binding subunit